MLDFPVAWFTMRLNEPGLNVASCLLASADPVEVVMFSISASIGDLMEKGSSPRLATP